MFGRLLLPIVALVSAWATPSLAEQANDQKAWTENCEDWDEWDRPGPPIKVFGNTYYVGTCGITVLAIATDEGLVVIDSGTRAAAEIVRRNLRRSGLRIEDVKILLMSHEHHDHVGGLGKLQRLSGAQLLASPEAAPVMQTGEALPNDPQFGMHNPFPSARVDGEVEPGQPVLLGALALTPIRTPGHTPGALSWQWQSCEGNECKTIVYADSLTPISNEIYRFSEHPGYVDAFRAGIDELAALDCDILLTPHPSASGMRDKLIAGDLTGGMNCREYANGLRKRLDERLAKEAAEASQ